MPKTYIIKYCDGGRASGNRVTLTITAPTQKALVAYLREHVEPAWNKTYNTRLSRYIAEVINMRDSEGGTNLWGIYNEDGSEIWEFVDGYSWHDEWDNIQDAEPELGIPAEEFVNKTVVL